MTQITRLARGLQEYLGTQNQGQNPVELNQQVSPGIDMGRYYDIDNIRWSLRAFSPTAIDTTLLAVIVPQNEIWFVRSITWRLVFAGATAGDSCRVSVDTARNPNVDLSTGQIVPISTNPTSTFVSANVFAVDHEIDQMLWGGTEIYGRVNDVQLTGGAINGQMHVEYLRLRF